MKAKFEIGDLLYYEDCGRIRYCVVKEIECFGDGYEYRGVYADSAEEAKAKSKSNSGYGSMRGDEMKLFEKKQETNWKKRIQDGT